MLINKYWLLHLTPWLNAGDTFYYDADAAFGADIAYDSPSLRS